MKATPYDGRDQALAPAPKPLEISEPEGKNYTITGSTLHWRNWDFHVRLDSRVGVVVSTVTYNDKGARRKVIYEGSLGGMIVPYGDPEVGWYFKAYLDSGEYGMGTLTSSIQRGQDAPDNAVLLDATLADFEGKPTKVPVRLPFSSAMPAPNTSIRSSASPTSASSDANWLFAGSAPSATTTVREFEGTRASCFSR